MKKLHFYKLMSKHVSVNWIPSAFFFFMLFYIASPAFSQIREIRIDPSKTYQTIENFTASDAWSGNFVGKYWDEKQKGQIAEWLFSQQYDASGNPAGIGLSMWRVNLGAGTLEQDSADIMPFQRRAESFLTKDGKSYDWEKCTGQQYFMQKAAEYGCNNFLLFSNSPLVQYTKNGKGWSSSDKEANIKPDCYSKYAGYMADVARYFSEKKGLHIAYISPINEPQVEWDTPRQEGSSWRSSEMKKMFVELDKALTSNNLDNVKILPGESSSLQALYETPASVKERYPEGDAPDKQISTFFDPGSPNYVGNLKNVPPIIAGHSYGSHKTNKEIKETREKVKSEAEKYGVSFHQSEWCLLPGLKPPMDGFTPDWEAVNYAGMQPALLLGRLMYGDFVYAGAKAWGYWKGMEINGNHALVSLYPTDGDLLKGGLIRTNKMLWALGNYSFFIRPGYTRIGLWGADNPDTLAASAYMAPDKSRIVAVYVNSSFETIPVSISILQGYDKKVEKVSVFRTDDRTDLANMYVPEKFSSDTEYEIPPRSLVTMVFDF
ncbi:MAG TPA: beta-glycosidase [Prolixibacteraceae bacterium]|nr:beta-glycosidase [Prolixibacteraceae bacterium]HCU59853.1 beta-glycosidase [Prolixibacteraceae bacterium]